MNKQFIFICLVCGMLFSTTLKSQINSTFSSSAEIAATGNNVWIPISSSSKILIFSVNTTDGWGVMTNQITGGGYNNDTRMVYNFSPTINYGGTSSHKYILAKEQDIAGTNNLAVRLRYISGSNYDFTVATTPSSGRAISRYVVPGTNSVLCLARVKDMYNGTLSYLTTERAISQMHYGHTSTSTSVINTFNVDFIKSYLDSADVFGSTEMDLAKYDINFNSSTYTTGFSASPTTLATETDNFILQSNASGTTDQAILTYLPAVPFLWTFSKQNVLVYKVNKNSIRTNSHLKIKLSVPSTISPYATTVFEYATPQYDSGNFDSNFKQVNIPGSNDYFLIFNLDGLTCGTSGAPSITALKTQNACTTTQLQLLLYGGLQASEVVKVDYVKPFASMSAAYTYVNGIVSGAPAIKSATTINALSTTYGTASATQNLYVSGCNLTADLVATAPAGFELNKDNGGTWASSVTFAQTSGIAGGTLKIRLKADAAVGNYNSQNIVLSSTGATSVNITTPASGNVVNALSSAISSSGNLGNASSLAGTNVTVSTNTDLTVNSTTTVLSLSLAPGAKLNIGTGNTLTATNGITLQSDATGTATILNSGTFTGTVTAEQYLGTARNWYVSSPVSAATSPATNITRYYEYVEAGNNADFSVTGSTAYWKGLNAGNTMETGKGYIAQASAGTTVSFSGTPNNGDITTTFDLTRDDAKGKGFNLVGNPYPSYIDWSLVTTANPNLNKTFYFRSKNTNTTSTYTFVSYNGLLNTSVSSNGTANTTITRFIPPTQAFWVRVNSGTNATKMFFNNDMRAHRDDNGNLLKAPKLDSRTRLRLQLINGTESDETLICSESNADNGFDMYDSPKMMNNSSITPDLYTKADAERLVINGLNVISDNMEVPLGFSLNAAASLKLKASEISNFADGTRIYLLDKTDNKQIELTPETEYSFSTTTATTNNESRFSLLFRVPGNTTGVSNTEKGITKVFVNTQNHITIIAKPNSNYSIYNAVGQLIENGTLNSELQTTNCKLQTGIFVVKVNNVTERVIVK